MRQHHYRENNRNIRTAGYEENGENINKIMTSKDDSKESNLCLHDLTLKDLQINAQQEQQRIEGRETYDKAVWNKTQQNKTNIIHTERMTGKSRRIHWIHDEDGIAGQNIQQNIYYPLATPII